MWRRLWHPTPVLLPGKSRGRRSLVGCSPWGREESDMTERLHFHFSLSCTGEGNGNPLQCSCLENPRDGGAWWAAVFGVTQSQTRLKWLNKQASKILMFYRFTTMVLQGLNFFNWGVLIFLVCFHSLMAQTIKNLPTFQETQIRSLGREDPLEKGMATYSSILAWRIPWTEEPGGLWSIGSQKSQTWPRD